VISFRKLRRDELVTQLTLSFDEDPATFRDKAQAILREALEAHPGSPADRLYDELVSRMVRRGEFERHNFDALLRSVAEEVITPSSQGGAGGGSRWYLLETADQIDAAESAKEEAAAARLEEWMRGKGEMAKWRNGQKGDESALSLFPSSPLALSPLEGFHYSDLFEHYLPVPDKPRRLLADWLPEFFFRTPEGTWRPPANEEERAQKDALRTGGTLRHIRRFARALAEGVPPHERDRPANAATAADWIRQCRRAGLYELGRALYEKGGFSFEELGDVGAMEVEEDYQVCVRRSG
jgi:hypothetical protein